MSVESPKSPESELPKYENLSESQKEMLKSQFGIEDAEVYEFAMDADIKKGNYPFTPEEIQEYLKQFFEAEQ